MFFDCRTFEVFFYHINPVIEKIGKWSLAKHNLSTVTNNSAASMNALLKNVLEGKEFNIDEMVLVLYIYKLWVSTIVVCNMS